MNEIGQCAACGATEHLDLLDAKPEPRVKDYPGQWLLRAAYLWWQRVVHGRTGSSAWDDPDGNTNWERLECVACYGLGWETNLSPAEAADATAAPELWPHYLRYYGRRPTP